MTRVKTWIVFLAIAVFPLCSFAQLKGFGIGPYIESAWPVGRFENTHQRGTGAGIGADLNLPARLGLTASAGYLHFSAKNNDGSKWESVNAVPLRLGVKYRLPGVYFKLESGMAKMINEGVAPLIFAPGVGVRVLGIDINGKFEAWVKRDTWSFWGIKATYQF